MALPKVAIVGRPNVGKSSVFNWIAERRIAIVEQVAGVTRDRITTLVQLTEGMEPRFVELIDTGGVGIVDRDDLSEHVEKQIQCAIDEADLILFVVDGRDGRMPLDEEVADRLRLVDKPIILVINKTDTHKLEDESGEFVRLGRGRPVYVSAKENRNRHQLIELMLELLPESTEQAPKDAVMKVAVVGRPNTGKSTFINTLARAERMIVSEIPGTTRDSVDVRFELDGLPFLAIDTAGVRRHAKIRDSIDFFSIHRAQRSIRRADVVLMFIDPTQGVTRLDKQLVDYISQEHKPCIFTINKWDLIADDPEAGDSSTANMQRFANAVQHAFRGLSYLPMAFITAKTGKNVKALVNLAQSTFKQANKRVGTGTLNRILRDAVLANSPPMRENKVPKIYFATQVSVAPPTIVLFVNRPTLFDPTYLRYLINTFRQKLPFRDIPIKLYLRARTQSADGSGSGGKPAEEPGIEESDLNLDEHWLQTQEINEELENLQPD